MQQNAAAVSFSPQVYLASLGEASMTSALLLAERLRDVGLCVQCDAGGGSLKSQLKRADRSGARLALLLGDEERTRGVVTVKDLRRGSAQVEIAQSDIADYVKQRLSE
jgi:histidyl-tRNA synthetase